MVKRVGVFHKRSNMPLCRGDTVLQNEEFGRTDARLYKLQDRFCTNHPRWHSQSLYKMNLGSTGMRYIHLMQGYYRMLACMYGVYTMIGVEKSLQNEPFVRMLSHPIL